MFCVKSQQSVEDIIKKSRFIGVIAPSISEVEVMQVLRQLHAGHPSASHIAFAYRIKTDHGIIYRFHDAGEPTGTAGKPIYQHLEGKDLINVLVAVIRYFGGIKLGAGGLTRAYGGTAKLVIDAQELVPYIERVIVALRLEYSQIQPLEYLLKKIDGQIVEQVFEGQVKMLVSIPASELETLAQAFPGVY